MEEGDDSEEISYEIWQEACWTVISAYFEEKGKDNNWIIQNRSHRVNNLKKFR